MRWGRNVHPIQGTRSEIFADDSWRAVGQAACSGPEDISRRSKVGALVLIHCVERPAPLSDNSVVVPVIAPHCFCLAFQGHPRGMADPSCLGRSLQQLRRRQDGAHCDGGAVADNCAQIWSKAKAWQAARRAFAQCLYGGPLVVLHSSRRFNVAEHLMRVSF